jgi:hypothetical protein
MNDFFKSQVIQSSDTPFDILNKIAFATKNEVFLNISILKLIASPVTYPNITSHIYKLLKDTATTYKTVVVHVYLKTINLSDLDKHKTFVIDMIKKCNDELPDILDVCYMYKAPFVFAQIYSVISVFIDKETKQKIHIVK